MQLSIIINSVQLYGVGNIVDYSVRITQVYTLNTNSIVVTRN